MYFFVFTQNGHCTHDSIKAVLHDINPPHRTQCKWMCGWNLMANSWTQKCDTASCTAQLHTFEQCIVHSLALYTILC